MRIRTRCVCLLLGFPCIATTGCGSAREEFASVTQKLVTDCPTVKPAGWWDPAWACRKKLVFQNASTGGPLFNHRTMVKLNGNVLSDYGSIRPGGRDIRFVSNSGSVLAHHIAHWCPNATATGCVTADSHVWVKVPFIPHDNTGYVWLYYNNPTSPDGQNLAAAWDDSAFSGVFTLGGSNSAGIVGGDETHVYRDVARASTSASTNVHFATPSGAGFPGASPVAAGGVLSSAYSASVNRTFIAYPSGGNGHSVDGYLTYFDHGTKTWGTPRKIVDCTVRCTDSHASVEIIVDNNNYVHAFYAVHNDPILHVRSSRPVTAPSFWSSSTWDLQRDLPTGEDTGHATYLNAVKRDSGNVYVFYRNTYSDPVHGGTHPGCPLHRWYEPMRYLKGSWNGSQFTWTSHLAVDPGGCGNGGETGWGTVYPHAVKYYRHNSQEGAILLWSVTRDHNVAVRNRYYTYFRFDNETFVGARNINVGSSITPNELDSNLLYSECDTAVNPSCELTQGDYNWPFPAIGRDATGAPHFIVYHRGARQTRHYYWTGAAWKFRTILPPPGFSQVKILPQLVLDVASPTDMNLYGWAFNTTRDPSLDLLTAPRAVVRYHHSGVIPDPDHEQWTLDEVIMGPAREAVPTPSIFPGPTDCCSAGPGSELKLILGEVGPYDWSAAPVNARLYGYGSAGFLRGSTAPTRYSSPVGPAIHLSGSTANTESIAIHEKSLDGTPLFSTQVGQPLAIEVLVKFDSLSPNQFIVGRSAEARGFSLKQTQVGGSSVLEWYVGDGSSYRSVRSGAIAPNTWYYVVASLSHTGGMTTLRLNVNGVEATSTSAFVPALANGDGVERLVRLGAPSLEDVGLLDGTLGGYLAFRRAVPSSAYIEASRRNFLGNFVSYSSQ